MSMFRKVSVKLFSLIQTKRYKVVQSDTDQNVYTCQYAAKTGPQTGSYSGLHVPDSEGQHMFDEFVNVLMGKKDRSP